MHHAYIRVVSKTCKFSTCKTNVRNASGSAPVFERHWGRIVQILAEGTAPPNLLLYELMTARSLLVGTSKWVKASGFGTCRLEYD